MCQRRANEPAWSYAFRMVCEKPSAVLAVIGWIVAALFVWMAHTFYQDNKASNERQTAAYMEVAQLMAEVRAEMKATREHLNKLDTWHRQEYMDEHKK